MNRFLAIDRTHDANRKSWVTQANDERTDFPIQNLPLGVFSTKDGNARVGTAVGDRVLDLALARELGLLGDAVSAEHVDADSLNLLLSQGLEAGLKLRHRLFDLLGEKDPLDAKRFADQLLHPLDSVTLHRPVNVANYTDFYAGIHHAVRAGGLLQPENPLPDNYKWVPIGYHGRPSTVKVSGSDVRRPTGQLVPGKAGTPPVFGPCKELDLELEMAVYVGKPTEWGTPLRIEDAFDHIAGFGLLNDWSARDIQKWEMKPLGPFLSKNFGTSISPWIITTHALAPFRGPVPERAPGDPRPLPYLQSDQDQSLGAIDIELQVYCRTAKMRRDGEAAVRLIESNMLHLYWTPQQMLTHHTVTGCQMDAGDILGTGTISGPVPEQLGSLLELTENGGKPVALPNGEVRSYLEDGDEITLTGTCRKAGFRTIGFGACRGTILPA